VTRLDRQLRNELRALAARVATLEATQAARPAKRKRVRAPRPDDSIITGRLKVWSKLILLYLQIRHARLTKLRFCVKYRLGDPSDFCRFFSPHGRGIAEGSVPAARYYAALKEALAELETLRDNHGCHFHGVRAGSPSFGAHVQ
jgi:hypothetical protein